MYEILSPSPSRAGESPPLSPPAVPQPKKERRHRPAATVCRRRRYHLPGHSPTGVLPIGRGARLGAVERPSPGPTTSKDSMNGSD